MPYGIYPGNKGKKLSKATRRKMSLSRQLEKHPNWKGGRIFDGKYIRIKNRKHPSANQLGYVYEHRIIVEKFLGRYLKKTESVHHINGNRIDNRIQNFLVFKNEKAHQKLEKNGKLIKSEIILDGRKKEEHNGILV